MGKVMLSAGVKKTQLRHGRGVREAQGQHPRYIPTQYRDCTPDRLTGNFPGTPPPSDLFELLLLLLIRTEIDRASKLLAFPPLRFLRTHNLRGGDAKLPRAGCQMKPSSGGCGVGVEGQQRESID